MVNQIQPLVGAEFVSSAEEVCVEFERPSCSQGTAKPEVTAVEFRRHQTMRQCPAEYRKWRYRLGKGSLMDLLCMFGPSFRGVRPSCTLVGVGGRRKGFDSSCMTDIYPEQCMQVVLLSCIMLGVHFGAI